MCIITGSTRFSKMDLGLNHIMPRMTFLCETQGFLAVGSAEISQRLSSVGEDLAAGVICLELWAHGDGHSGNCGQLLVL